MWCILGQSVDFLTLELSSNIPLGLSLIPPSPAYLLGEGLIPLSLEQTDLPLEGLLALLACLARVDSWKVEKAYLSSGGSTIISFLQIPITYYSYCAFKTLG